VTLDLDAVLRAQKPERRRRQLTPRATGIVAVADMPAADKAAVLLDTNVFIRQFAGTLPPEVEALFGEALLWHASVCVAELAAGVGAHHPDAPGWRRARDHYAGLVARIPRSRLLVPDARTWAEAGLLSGTVARTQGLQPHQRKEFLADALVFLCAARRGVPVITSDRDDYDLLQQLVPTGRFYAYT
jgi:predicted nucleic acid-binding protein